VSGPRDLPERADRGEGVRDESEGGCDESQGRYAESENGEALDL
jgi:hypothetical protein